VVEQPAVVAAAPARAAWPVVSAEEKVLALPFDPCLEVVAYPQGHDLHVQALAYHVLVQLL
jgi:hypothetical protein